LVTSRDELIHQQYDELVQTFPDLELSKDKVGQWIVAGVLHFSASIKGKEPIEDTFSVQIVIPDDYPDAPPLAFEVGGRIPREADFHINESGEMCLAVSVEVRKKFSGNPTLFQFVEKLVVPFLYGFSYRERYGEWPWGAYSGKSGHPFRCKPATYSGANRPPCGEAVACWTGAILRGCF